MLQRIATCACGNVGIRCSGEPARISMCHCLACQRRTGAPFGVQAWFQHEQLDVSGKGSEYSRIADSGNSVIYHFCPTCGSTVFCQLSSRPGLVAIAFGMFADPHFPPPRVSVWERRRHPWTVRIADCQMEHEA